MKIPQVPVLARALEQHTGKKTPGHTGKLCCLCDPCVPCVRVNMRVLTFTHTVHVPVPLFLT